MAERARDGLQLQSRRVSFRQSIADASLPDELLEQLELKRRTLDDSIHKYIASKEREYKNFERDLRQQAKNHGHVPVVTAGGRNGGAVNGNGAGGDGGGGGGGGGGGRVENHHGSKRRTSTESTTLSIQESGTGSPFPNGQRSPAVNALMTSGRRRDSESLVVDAEDEGSLTERKSAITGLIDRRASLERDEDFVGLFTPPYLPALEDKMEDRGAPCSTPMSSSFTPDKWKKGAENGEDAIARAPSDPTLNSAAQAKAKRPAQLVIASRTSSSGSSQDGRLASAMKSPTQKERPKRKRVSLAVGDSIVAPSDNVPVSQSSTSNAPSHSYIRTPAAEHTTLVPYGESVLVKDSKPADMSAAQRAQQIMCPATVSSSTDIKDMAQMSTVVESITARATSNATSKPGPAAVDPDGDLFDLEEDSDGGLVRHNHDDLSGADSDFPPGSGDEEGISGRVNPSTTAQISTTDLASNDREYDAEASLIPEPETANDDGNREVHLEFRPGSIGASRQPTNPGFRRPSVSHDPIFKGAGYEAAASQAAEGEVYGSSYSRPGDRGSYGGDGGSLGESFMERNAIQIRMAAARTQGEVEG